MCYYIDRISVGDIVGATVGSDAIEVLGREHPPMYLRTRQGTTYLRVTDGRHTHETNKLHCGYRYMFI